MRAKSAFTGKRHLNHGLIDAPRDEAARAEFNGGLRAMGRCPNIYAKISGVIRRVSGQVPEDAAFYKPSLDGMWEAFGPRGGRKVLLEELAGRLQMARARRQGLSGEFLGRLEWTSHDIHLRRQLLRSMRWQRERWPKP
jgi:hypothetical protein